MRICCAFSVFRVKIFVDNLKDCNITARVLPTSEVLAECENLGLTPKQIIAVQGAFSVEMNIEMFKHAQAEVIVTKDSGKIGGADTKIAAAQVLKIPVVVIDRPKISYPNVATTFNEVFTFLLELKYSTVADAVLAAFEKINPR